MEEEKWWGKETVAVVTGANRGIGLEIVHQLACKGLTVVLTCRNEQQGVAAARALVEAGLDNVHFHILDVQSSESVSDLAEWLRIRFGGLDILVNNAAVLGQAMNWELMDKKGLAMRDLLVMPNPILRKQLSDMENISEKVLDSMLTEFLEDVKQNKNLEEKGWPAPFSAYKMSKLCMNTYTRLLARELCEKVYVNCVHPGYVKTEMTFNTGDLSDREGAENVVRLTLFPVGGPSGKYFVEKEMSGF